MAKPLRSQATRDRILAEAGRLFAERGFDRTTVRAVADAAGSSPGLVIRYYVSKEELFAAAMAIDLRLPELAAVPRDRVGEALVRHFLSRWGAADPVGELPALLRAAVGHEGARERVLALFRTQVAPALAPLCRGPDPAESAALIGAQLVGLALSRYVLRLEPVTALAEEAIVRRVGGAIQLYLDG